MKFHTPHQEFIIQNLYALLWCKLHRSASSQLGMKLYPSIATFVTCGRVAHKTSRQIVGKWIATHHINNQGQLLPCFHVFIFSFMENWTSMQIAQKSVSKSIQNECAADSAGGVQRGLGMLPQQAICENFSSGGIFVNKWTCTGLHCLPICNAYNIRAKLFPSWE